MYEALGIAMQANGSTPADIERALMSAVDFSTQNLGPDVHCANT